MELPSKLLEQAAFNTRPKTEKHMLIDIDKSTHVEHLSQPLQTRNTQFKIAVTFLTGYDGIFNVTDKTSKFYFNNSSSDIEPSFIKIAPRVYELENLDAEIKRICINKEHFGEDDYPFKIKHNFSTLGSTIEIDVGMARQVSFMHDDSIRDLFRFKPKVIQEE